MESIKNALGGLFSRFDNAFAYSFAFYAIIGGFGRAALYLAGTKVPYDYMLVANAVLTAILFALTLAGGFMREGKTYRPAGMYLMALALVVIQIVPTYQGYVVNDNLILQTLTLEATMLIVATAMFGRSWFRDVVNVVRLKGTKTFDLLRNDVAPAIAAKMKRQPTQGSTQETSTETPVEKLVERKQASVTEKVTTAPAAKPEANANEEKATASAPQASVSDEATFFARQVTRAREGRINPFVFGNANRLGYTAIDISKEARENPQSAYDKFVKLLAEKASPELQAEFNSLITGRVTA